jgi:hypothetical protein
MPWDEPGEPWELREAIAEGMQTTLSLIRRRRSKPGTSVIYSNNTFINASLMLNYELITMFST